MFLKSMTKAAALVAACVLVAGAAEAVRGDDVRMQGAGSTFVAPIMQRWTTEYQKLHPTVAIDYQSIGSGGGIKGITEKTIDFGATDAPVSKKEIEKAGGGLINIPVIAGAVVPAYNLPGLNGELKLDGPVLAGIYLGKIVRWNDATIAALNPGVQLPDLAVTPTHRTDGSGTSYIFTNYLSSQSEDFKDKIGAGKQVEWPGGQGGKGNEGVTQVVQGTPGAIGYVELAYADQNHIAYAAMKNKEGEFIKASPKATAMAGDAASKEMKDSLVAGLWDQSGKGVYPIAGFTYVLVYKDLGYLKSESKAQALADFLIWCTHEGQKDAEQLDYAPLNGQLQERVGAALAELTFEGHAVREVKNSASGK